MATLVHPKERVYFATCFAVSIVVYAGLLFWAFKSAVTFGVVLFYIALGALFALVSKGMFIGRVRGNAVRVSERQFPHVYGSVQRMAERMELNSVPAVYVLQSGGLLNAFAIRFVGRNMIVVFSDILELAYEQGEAALDFVVCHELAHLKRRHLTWRTLLLPSFFIIWLALAYSRACEYTCDRFGAFYVPQGAEKGILILAAGKKLYRQVNGDEFQAQSRTETGFWVWYSEIYSTHPYLPKRLAAIRENLALQNNASLAASSSS